MPLNPPPSPPPSKAHGFVMRSMSLRDMQISKSEKKIISPPPAKSWGRPCVYNRIYSSSFCLLEPQLCCYLSGSSITYSQPDSGRGKGGGG